MLGHFQKSQIRIEIDASAKILRESLLLPEKLRQWVPFNNLSSEMPSELHVGLKFTNWNGLIPIGHYVDVVGDNSLRLILNQGIDGFHEWYWGEGWVQSRLEGVTMLPLALGNSLNLLILSNYCGDK
ncbi:hypothetical protein RINTHH_11020 [Richelia intracellularis HH01]|jgi:hypothetical protein|uniref:Uncharacterized protein n=1 Tax=Richelia intracellularis HH01 TaxID=1165094 RepID=M1WZ45_9NOST|nr:hypothetical protein [Richelia intracellularis]CCH67257.1 hypothetical protein RINTHH_11020 [Richelia intracellularis HH01]HAE06172.1 hypothetical protein [Richelia sp.]